MLALHAKVFAGAFALLFVCFNFSFSQDTKNLEKQLQKATEADDHDKVITLYYELGKASWRQQKLKKSLTYFEKGAELSENINDVSSAEYGWYSLGLVQLSLQDYSAAGKSFKNSYNMAESLGNQSAMAKSLVNQGKSFAGRGRYKRAIKELEASLSIGIRLNDSKLKQESYELLSDYYRKSGDNTKADQYLNHYNLLKNEAIRDQDLDEMEQQISFVKEALKSQGEVLEKAEDSLREVNEISKNRQLQIELLSTEKELTEVTLKAKDAELKNNRLVRNSLIAGVLLAGLLAGVIFTGYRNKAKANEQIHRQNINIKSSINYGQRIQEAMLPHKELFKKLLPQSFILFKPRDVVSGDFYWLKELDGSKQSKFAIAAVDCTGHGVPGAFMSMIGMNALNGIISNGVEKTDEILHHLHDQIHGSLKQDETGNQDGMDIALCVVNKTKRKLYFSGAKNHLIYFKNGQLFQIRGDKHPIGGRRRNADTYTCHEIDLEGTMHFYLYTDGYVDQFGGETNMKFMSKRFKDLLMNITDMPMEDQKIKLDRQIDTWMGKNKQTDDILVIGFTLNLE